MTQTSTTTETWSRTHARHIAGKAIADLRQMQQEYGQPGESFLNDLLEELVSYLAADYLDYVEYGFKRGGQWVVAHKYTAAALGTTAADQRSGGIRRGVDISGASWCSYLVQNSRWRAITQAQRDAFEAALPVKRTAGTEPSTGSVGWAAERSYSSGGGSLGRSGFGGNP